MIIRLNEKRGEEQKRKDERRRAERMEERKWDWVKFEQ